MFTIFGVKTNRERLVTYADTAELAWEKAEKMFEHFGIMPGKASAAEIKRVWKRYTEHLEFWQQEHLEKK